VRFLLLHLSRDMGEFIFCFPGRFEPDAVQDRTVRARFCVDNDGLVVDFAVHVSDSSFRLRAIRILGQLASAECRGSSGSIPACSGRTVALRAYCRPC